MSRLPVVNFALMDRILIKLGFIVARQRGSHVFYRHPDGRTTTLPNHGSRALARPLIREILREIEMSPDEFNTILKK